MSDGANTGASAGYPADRAALLAAIEAEWSPLMEAVEALTTAQWDTPGPGGWTPKDNLAHLLEWERYMLRRILRNESLEAAMELDRGTLEAVDLDEDGINELLHLRNKERFPGDVLDLLKMTHQAVIEELERVDFDWLLQSRNPSKPAARPRLAEVAGNTYEHFVEHRANIEAVVHGD